MEKYNILFRGYRRDINKAGLPTYSGIYIVYRCTFNQEKQTVSLKELLYIGQAQNIRDRIFNHNMHDAFIAAAKKGEQICYSYAEVDKQDLDILENALIFAQKPPLNDNLKDTYNHNTAQFYVEGHCALLDNTDFSIESYHD